MSRLSIDIGPSRQLFGSADVSQTVFAQTELTSAFSNRAPILPGHCLVIPRRGVASLFELNETEYVDLFLFAKCITQFLVDEFKGDGFDWSLQEGYSAGQSVEHLHLHIIPRKSGDLPNPGDWYPLLTSETENRLLDSRLRVAFKPEQAFVVAKELKFRFSNWFARQEQWNT